MLACEQQQATGCSGWVVVARRGAGSVHIPGTHGTHDSASGRAGLACQLAGGGPCRFSETRRNFN